MVNANSSVRGRQALPSLAKYSAISTIATGPLSQSAFIPSVWDCTTSFSSESPGRVASSIRVLTCLTWASSVDPRAPAFARELLDADGLVGAGEDRRAPATARLRTASTPPAVCSVANGAQEDHAGRAGGARVEHVGDPDRRVLALVALGDLRQQRAARVVVPPRQRAEHGVGDARVDVLAHDDLAAHVGLGDRGAVGTKTSGAATPPLGAGLA